MGWLTDRRIRRMRDPVEGTLTLTGTSAAPTAGVRAQSYSFIGTVQAPGMPATTVELTGSIAPADKWPRPGATLPVTVDRADPSHVVVRWADVPTNRELALDQADRDAFAARTGVDLDVLGQAVAGLDTTPPATRPDPRDPARPIDPVDPGDRGR